MPSLRSESLGNALSAKVQSLAQAGGAKVRASTEPAALRFGLARVVISAPCLFVFDVLLAYQLGQPGRHKVQALAQLRSRPWTSQATLRSVEGLETVKGD